VTLGFVSFGRRLKEYREHRGWSLANLARATHYSRGYLSNLENGRKAPAESVARRCDEVLRANGELIAAAKAATVARLDKAPWQTAELAQRLKMSDTSAGTIETLRPPSWSCAASTTTEMHWNSGTRHRAGSSTSEVSSADRSD